MDRAIHPGLSLAGDWVQQHGQYAARHRQDKQFAVRIEMRVRAGLIFTKSLLCALK
jgi:hypothetical protein